MPRLPSDHDSVETVRASVSTVGPTDRPCLDFPPGFLPEDEVVRLILDGDTFYAHVETDLSGTPSIRGAYDNRRLARTPEEGTNRLVEWLQATELPGDSVQVDAVTPDHCYGVRPPGRRVIYETTEPPDESLAAIARDLADDGSADEG